jgi:hypothetical protein
MKHRTPTNPLAGHQIHQFRDDEVPDHRGRTRCADCGLDRDHKLHQLPATDPAVVAAEARRIGEPE